MTQLSSKRTKDFKKMFTVCDLLFSKDLNVLKIEFSLQEENASKARQKGCLTNSTKYSCDRGSFSRKAFQSRGQKIATMTNTISGICKLWTRFFYIKFDKYKQFTAVALKTISGTGLLYMKFELKVLALKFVPLISVNGSIVHSLCNSKKQKCHETTACSADTVTWTKFIF